MDVIEALNLALAKEEESLKMYKEFAGEYPETKETFTFLAAEETKHKRLIEELIWRTKKH